MTSFDVFESSLESSRPLEVYRFDLGGDPSLYTSNPSDVTVGSETYLTEAMKRGPIAVGQTERQRILTIDMPITNSFVANYIGIPPGAKATVEIIRLQRDEVPAFDTKTTIYEGTIKSVEFPRPGLARVNVQTIEALTGRHMPQNTSMSMCNHTLYGPGCNVNPASFNIANKVVTAVSDRVMTVTDAAFGTSGFDFTGGYVKLSGSSDARLILKHDGDDITVLVPFKNIIAGTTTVDVFAGCDHLLGGDCALVFNNVIQNGGFNWVPTINIFTKGL